MSGGWNTIESDAGVFTFLLSNLGVKDVQFEELLTLDTYELSSLSPIYGVIFLFKYPSSTQLASQRASTTSSQPIDGTFDTAAAESLFFANQVIQNACGTQAVLSVLLNKDNEIDIGQPLRDFKEFTSAFPSDLRGEALSNSEVIRESHNAFARASPFIDEDTRAPRDGEEDDAFHFIAYTALNGTLYELDGLQPAPIAHGECGQGEFAEKVVGVLQRRIQRYGEAEIRFNLLAMVRDRRIKMREQGDEEGLRSEARKRSEWRWENELRRHNFVGFTGEVLKMVVGQKVREGTYTNWIEEAVKTTQRKMEVSRNHRQKQVE